MRNLSFTPDGWHDYQSWQQDKRVTKRIHELINATLREPFVGIGKPEPLKGNLAGFWSRRINEEHRLVYAVKDTEIIVASLRDHYE